MISFRDIKKMEKASIKIIMDMKKNHIRTIITKMKPIIKKINTMMKNNTSKIMKSNQIKNNLKIFISIKKKNKRFIRNMKD